MRAGSAHLTVFSADNTYLLYIGTVRKTAVFALRNGEFSFTWDGCEQPAVRRDDYSKG